MKVLNTWTSSRVGYELSRLHLRMSSCWFPRLCVPLLLEVLIVRIVVYWVENRVLLFWETTTCVVQKRFDLLELGQGADSKRGFSYPTPHL